MTDEQKSWWVLNLWFGLPAAIELILIVGLIAIISVPESSFPKKKRIFAIVLAAILAIPACVWFSTLTLESHLKRLQDSAFNEPNKNN